MDELALDEKASLAVEYAAARLGRPADGELVEFLAKRYLDKPSRARADAVGAQELHADEFDGFEQKCPKCGFEWDD